MYELRSPSNEVPNVQALDDSLKEEKKYDHNVDIHDDYANYKKQKQPQVNGGGFFSMFCGCFAPNNKKKNEGNAPQPKPQPNGIR